jgi:acetyl esterase/lipase
VISAGGSAGGNLAIAATLKLLDKNIVSGVAALVPFTVHPDAVPAKYKSHYTSYSDCSDTPIINTRSMEIFQGGLFTLIIEAREFKFPQKRTALIHEMSASPCSSTNG